MQVVCNARQLLSGRWCIVHNKQEVLVSSLMGVRILRCGAVDFSHVCPSTRRCRSVFVLALHASGLIKSHHVSLTRGLTWVDALPIRTLSDVCLTSNFLSMFLDADWLFSEDNRIALSEKKTTQRQERNNKKPKNFNDE